MTNTELMAQAVLLNDVLSMHDETDPGERERCIAAALSDARRVALIEAVKATCWRCQDRMELRRDGRAWHHPVQYDTGPETRTCYANGIHNLLAAEPQEPGTIRVPAMED